jgi:hypothetical protein
MSGYAASEVEKPRITRETRVGASSSVARVVVIFDGILGFEEKRDEFSNWQEQRKEKTKRVLGRDLEGKLCAALA